MVKKQLQKIENNFIDFIVNITGIIMDKTEWLSITDIFLISMLIPAIMINITLAFNLINLMK